MTLLGRPLPRGLARVAATVSAGLVVTLLITTLGPAPLADAATSSPSTADAGPSVGMIVKSADLSRFQPGNIMSDAVFFNATSMTSQHIQDFLNDKVSRCQSGYVCLKDFRQDTATIAPGTYCNGYAGAANESAATVVYKVAASCGINPQVLLVTLQKEQGLITHTWPSDWRYTIAMGQGCPDTADCDTRYYGFQNQVYGAARQFKIYAEGKYFTYYAPGSTWNILYNPDRGCGTAPVTVQNTATAGLYYYTPYQPNAAAIRAGYGEGDGCSSYGNRNFYQYFTDWFGSTQYVATDTPFVDVSSVASSPVYSVFAADIAWAASSGISSGWVLGDGAREYRPSLAVTRDVMAAFLYRLAGQPAHTAPSMSPFIDVAVDHGFYKEISWLASTGISGGWVGSAGPEFRPAEAVSRDVMAAFLYRFAGQPSFTAPEASPFVDVAVSHPFYKEISWLAAAGISGGWAVSDGKEFRPALSVTRDVMAAFLHRMDRGPTS
jgi:hypothetical protein